MEIMKPKIFISYNHSDSAFVDSLAEDLKATGMDIWIDKLKVQVGDSIIQRVNEGLHESDFLIVVLSKSSIKSRWVQEELNAATLRNIESTRQAFVLPIVIEDCDIPLLLRHRKYADFKANPEVGFRDVLESIRPGLAQEFSLNCAGALKLGYNLSHDLLILPLSPESTPEDFEIAEEALEVIVEAYEKMFDKPDQKKLTELKNILSRIRARTFSMVNEAHRLDEIQRLFSSLGKEAHEGLHGRIHRFFYLGYIMGKIALNQVSDKWSNPNEIIARMKELDLMSSINLGLPQDLVNHFKKVAGSSGNSVPYEEIQGIMNQIILYLAGSPAYH
jgi:hypothetical protein